MKISIIGTLVACFVLCSGTQGLRAGVVDGADDAADGCGSGSGGGDPSRGAAPGGPDAVSWAMPSAAAAGGGAVCFAACGGKAGGDNSGDSGGTCSACGPGDDDNGSQPGRPPGAGGGRRPGGGGLVPILGVGMPVWEVSEPYINLWLYDEPLGYQPGVGPRLSFRLAYKQRGAPVVSPKIYSVGTNWTCSWLNYVEDDGIGSQAALTMKSGSRIVYTPPDGSAM